MKKIFILAILTSLVAAPAAFGQNGDITVANDSDLAKIIQWQNQKLEELQERVEALEAGVGAEDGDNLVVPKVAEKITLFGDLRYRHEFIDMESGVDDRNRHRLRARVGLKAKLSEQLDLVFQLASGSSSGPTSTNQTLDGAFSSKDVWIDKAYFDYHPEWCEGLSILGGKFSNPFDTHSGSSMIWDGDLRTEGMAVVSDAEFGSVATNLTAGGLWVDEDSSGANSMLWGVQGSAAMPLADSVSARAGASYYGFSDIEGHAAFNGFQGNTSVGGLYAEDFGIAEVFAELEAKLAENLKGTLYGSYVNNTQADNDLDTGYLVGVKLGTKVAGKKVSFKYDWRDIEADAVVGGLNDSDFGGGGTDARGHKFGASIKPTDRTEVAVTYLMNEVGIDGPEGKGDGELDYDRVQIDLKFKF